MGLLKEKIRKYIVSEVFVRGADQRIIPEANWLMDFRRVCLDPEFLDVYTEIFYQRFKDQYPFQVGGMEVAAIPLVAAIVMKMRERGMPINGFFIRKSRKKTGLLKMVEGKLTDDPVVLVDDLINSGSTLDRQLKVMEEGGRKVLSYFVVLRFRSLPVYQKYSDQGIVIESLFGLDEFSPDFGTKLLNQKESSLTKEKFSVQWYFKVPGALLEAVVPKSGVVFDDTKVYFGSDHGIVYALIRSDGSVAWSHQIGLGPWGSKRDKQIFSTPVIHTGRLYFGAFDGNIYCIDAATGKRIWVSFEADWIAGSFAINRRGTCLYVPTVFGGYKKSGGVVALNTITGKTLWRTKFPFPIRSTPLLVEKKKLLFVGSERGVLYCLNSDEGGIVWSFSSGGAIKDAPIYDELAQTVIVTSFDGGTYCLDAFSGLLRWKFDIGLANYGAPCLWGDSIFVCSLDKNLYCLHRVTGEKKWIFPARARIFSSPRIFRGKLYFGNNEARMREIDPETGKETGYFQAVERITNPVIFDEKTGDFFLQTYANELFMLREKQDLRS